MVDLEVSDEIAFDVQTVQTSYKVWAIVFIVAFCLLIIANISVFVYWWRKGYRNHNLLL